MEGRNTRNMVREIATRKSLRKIYIGGTFDGMHEGHKELFADARKIINDGLIIIAINSDSFFKKYKPNVKLMFNQDKRIEMIEKELIITNNKPYDINLVNYEDQISNIEKHNPDFILHGTDWMGESLANNFGVNYKWFSDRNILFVYTDRRSKISSTDIRKKINNNI